MIKLKEYREIFIVIGSIGTLLIAYYASTIVFQGPTEERFSELWILGPNNIAENYPFNVNADETYLVQIGVGNHQGYSAYAAIYVKLRNQTDQPPNIDNGSASPLSILYAYPFFIQEGENLTEPLTFSFSGISFHENQCTVTSVTVNGATATINRSISWDPVNSGYYYQLFLELWIYDIESSGFRFQNRFVGLWLNMTS